MNVQNTEIEVETVRIPIAPAYSAGRSVWLRPKFMRARPVYLNPTTRCSQEEEMVYAQVFSPIRASDQGMHVTVDPRITMAVFGVSGTERYE